MSSESCPQNGERALLIHIKISHEKRNPSSLFDLEGHKRGVEECRLTDHKLYFKIYCFDL